MSQPPFKRAPAPSEPRHRRPRGATKKPANQILERVRSSMSDVSLLDLALTHASFSATSTRTNYERLEFLGDAVLGLVVVEYIYGKFPDAPEGPLARLKASLVSAETLSDIATEFTLLEHARLGEMSRAQREMARKNVGADLVESLIGAVYLDQGLEAARTLIFELYGERLKTATLGVTGARDAKTELHELVQGTLHERPAYHVLRTEGMPHARQFLVEVRIREHACGQAWGPNHKGAEQGAAAKALEAIHKGEIELVKLEPPQQ